MSLAKLPELVGFFSYSRRDDQHSDGALSRLRARIHSELRLQLGRDFRLWQDTAAIPDGSLWEDEIKRAIAESVFFIPIVTPSSVGSKHCRFEFESFRKREVELGRSNLIFPVLYVRVPALEREEEWRQDEVLKVVGSRQYIDWQRLRHRSFSDAEVAEKVEQYCRNIVEALRQPWVPPTERRRPEDVQTKQRAEEERPRKPVEVDGAPRAEERTRNQTPSDALAQLEMKPSPQTAEPRAKSRRSAILGLAIGGAALALGLVAYLFISEAPRAPPPQQPTATSPSLPQYPTLNKAACADSLCGTSWRYTATSVTPPTHDLYFLQNNVLVWTEPGSFQIRAGYNSTYSVTNDSVYFQINNKFSEYRGTIQGQQMTGSAENQDGKAWSWAAVKRQ